MQIKNTSFDGLKAVEIKTSRARLILVTEIGPRIAHLSAIRGKAESRNLLFWDFKKKYRRKDWMLRGGHRVWGTRPGADEAEETYAPDNGPADVSLDTRSFTVPAAMDPVQLTRRGFTVTALAPDRLDRWRLGRFSEGPTEREDFSIG